MISSARKMVNFSNRVLVSTCCGCSGQWLIFQFGLIHASRVCQRLRQSFYTEFNVFLLWFSLFQGFPSLSGSPGVPELLFLVLLVMKKIGFLFNGSLAFQHHCQNCDCSQDKAANLKLSLLLQNFDFPSKHVDFCSLARALRQFLYVVQSLQLLCLGGLICQKLTLLYWKQTLQ